jgi:hypothetical protein
MSRPSGSKKLRENSAVLRIRQESFGCRESLISRISKTEACTSGSEATWFRAADDAPHGSGLGEFHGGPALGRAGDDAHLIGSSCLMEDVTRRKRLTTFLDLPIICASRRTLRM